MKQKVSHLINRNFGEEYNNFLEFFNVKNDYVLDKTLTNFWYIGFIKIFFQSQK